jgi:hypothetical protein
MSRKFGKQFAPVRNPRVRKPVRCGRCRTTIPVRESRYPSLAFGEVCATCNHKLAAKKPDTAPVGSDAKAAATREQAARLVQLAAEREAEREP